MRQCYDDVMKLNVATVQNVLNYAELLWKNSYFEDSFRAYERGVHLFPYPHVMVIWKTYLKRFLERHQVPPLFFFKKCLFVFCEIVSCKFRFKITF